MTGNFWDNSQTTGLVMSRCGNINHSRAVFLGAAARLVLRTAFFAALRAGLAAFFLAAMTCLTSRDGGDDADVVAVL